MWGMLVAWGEWMKVNTFDKKLFQLYHIIMSKLNLYKLQEKFGEIKKSILTPQDLKLLFYANDRAINGFLTYNNKKGKILKLKKGLYGISKSNFSSNLIANLAYKPSYISFETALSYYHLIPETVYSIISATSKASREWNMQNTNYVYRSIKKEAYAGYIIKTIENEQVLIATPEKALADYCYFIYLGKIKEWNSRLELKDINLKKVKEYLKLFNNRKIINFIKKYLPQLCLIVNCLIG